VSIALVHHPVLDRDGQVIVTAVTNLDVHDLARSARTYAVKNVFIVHPVEAQRELIGKVTRHWTEGAGGKRIPDRIAAMERVRIVPALDEVLGALGAQAEVWTTAASASGETLSFQAARAIAATDGPPILLVYGTGWGLAEPVHARATARLAPIAGRDGWNHLSVRAAVAISLDRLLGA
jgi:hypothetical protein